VDGRLNLWVWWSKCGKGSELDGMGRKGCFSGGWIGSLGEERKGVGRAVGEGLCFCRALHTTRFTSFSLDLS
jgi:hypothetical protein